jgi:uncharacterized protein (TIGR03083 family)
VQTPQSDVVHLELDPTQVLAAHARHRRRFAEEVSQLDHGALETQSRCDKWTTADVLRHLCDVDSWMQALWTGRPVPFTSFDPNVTPHEFVIAAREVPDVQVRDNFVRSCEQMAADVENCGADRWGLPSVSPIGSVPWWLSALHVFYDSWVHERDALLPVGVVPPVFDDEATPVLAYSLALTGTFGREELDTVVSGVRLIAGRQPVVAEPVGSLDSCAAEVIDAVNGRARVEDALAGTDPEVLRRLGALARFFHAAA